MDSKILYKVYLSEELHKRTGEVNHYWEDELIEKLPHFLQIESWVEGEYYLIHYDENGEDMMSDTLHDSIDDAMEQAEWEFNIKKNEWMEP